MPLWVLERNVIKTDDLRLREALVTDTLSNIRLSRARGVYGTAKSELADAPFVRGLGFGLGALALGSLAYVIKDEVHSA